MQSYRDNAFWFSKLSDARKCPRLYKLKHIDKVTVEAPISADLEFGSAMHVGLHSSLDGGDALTAFNLYWDTLKDTEMARSRLDWDKLRETAEVLLTRFERLHRKHFEPFKMEERIFGKFGPHEIEGTPDYLGLYKGVPSVLDFKTAAYRYDKAKIICDEQMPGYAALAKQAHGYEVEQAVYMVFIKSATDPSIQVITAPLTDSRIQCTIDNVIETCDDLVGRKTFPMNTGSCIIGQTRCPFFSQCHGKESNDE
jgi:hypothetical protein